MAQPAIEDFEQTDTPVSEIQVSEEVLEAQQRAFSVTDDSSAEWAMRKLAKVRGKQDVNIAIQKAEIERLAKWLYTVNTALERDAEYFESLLGFYALEQRKDGRKSIVLPHGTVKTTGGRPKVEIDEKEFIKWAAVNAPELVRIKVEVAKDELKKLITDDLQVVTTNGEVVPSVTVTAGVPSVSFSIKK
jgi:hypothetical protein